MGYDVTCARLLRRERRLHSKLPPAKAPAAELKAKIAEFKADLQQKMAALESAQESLRQVLSARQEAIAVLAGLL